MIMPGMVRKTATARQCAIDISSKFRIFRRIQVRIVSCPGRDPGIIPLTFTA
jgi:hypothetical protein